MNPNDLLKNLPPLREIVEHPQVKAVVEKLHQSAVAGQVRGVVEDLRREITQRAGEIKKLTAGEVIDRVTRRLAGASAPTATSVINATGRLWGGDWAAAPWCEDAIDRVRQLGHDYLPQAANSAQAECDARLKKLTGAATVQLTTSRAAALGLTLRALQKRVIIARGEVGDVAESLRLTTLCAEFGLPLVEVGAAHQATLAEYEAALRMEGNASILKLQPEGYEVTRSAAAGPSLRELAELAKRYQSTLVVDLGGGPLVDSPMLPGVTATSAAAAIAAGAPIVILRGEGLLGGPQCGILLGSELELGVLRGHSLAALTGVEPRTALALAATLAAYDGEPMRRLPLQRLLDTPLDNLRTRAERLAPQLAAGGVVANAQPRELAAHESPQPSSLGALPSYGIFLTPRNESPAELAQRLASSAVAIHGRVESSGVLLDLRTVFPRQDLAMVECLTGSSSSPPAPLHPGGRGETS